MPLTGVFLYPAAICSSEIRNLVFDCKILAAQKLGRAPQCDQWVDEAARASAVRDGTIENVLSEEAVAILAKVLGGPKSTKYRVISNSKPGQFYEIEASGPGLDLVLSGV